MEKLGVTPSKRLEGLEQELNKLLSRPSESLTDDERKQIEALRKAIDDLREKASP